MYSKESVEFLESLELISGQLADERAILSLCVAFPGRSIENVDFNNFSYLNFQLPFVVDYIVEKVV